MFILRLDNYILQNRHITLLHNEEAFNELTFTDKPTVNLIIYK